MESIDKPIMEREEEQHDYENQTSISESKMDETTVTNADSGQYVNFHTKLRKESCTLSLLIPYYHWLGIVHNQQP